jgi:hypothetical protein
MTRDSWTKKSRDEDERVAEQVMKKLVFAFLSRFALGSRQLCACRSHGSVSGVDPLHCELETHTHALKMHQTEKSFYDF